MNPDRYAYPSLPSLFDDEYARRFYYPSLEGPIPADSPTLYKHGESSRLTQMKPMFHPQTNDSYKVWWNDSVHNKGIQFAPHCSLDDCIQTQQSGAWKGAEDISMDPNHYGFSQRNQPHYGPTGPHRLTSNSTSVSSCSIPISAARSSLHSLHSNPMNSGVDWRESPVEHGLFGPASPLSSATLFESDANLRGGHDRSSLIRPQPHNDPGSPTESPRLYHLHSSYHSASTASRNAFTACPPASPSSSSYSSSISESPSNSPPTPPTPVLLPELHQPRPGRPIPIIPLSKLATACEEIYVPPPNRVAAFSAQKNSFDRFESSAESLSQSLPISDPRLPSFPPRQVSNHIAISDRAYPYFDDVFGTGSLTGSV
ncbi:hypothetical protein H0H93_005739 [Arthromyces matolae]|nr:hypothetical protein H0H93_005739 [Arthromyces matolae]